MKKSKIYRLGIIALIFWMTNVSLFACTIFSGKDNLGHMWAGNNEDGLFNFKTYLNVFPSKCIGEFGYITFSYDSPENGANNNIQGGVNEAGLFFDFNALDMFDKYYVIADREKKKSFPTGDHKIFDHIMSNFETVQEVMDFFDKYWFDYGFNRAQMHLADKHGNFGIITSSGSRLLENETYQVSTNFSIYDNEDESQCWRFPIATEIIENEGAGLVSFTKVADRTAQRTWATTIYSNIHNLSTGDISLYWALDYENPFKTNIKELLSEGQKSYLMMELFMDHPISRVHKVFREHGGEAAVKTLNDLELDNDERKDVLNNLVLPLIVNEVNLDAVPLMDEFLRYEPVGYVFRVCKALSYFYNGDIDKAKEIIENYKKDTPETSLDTDRFIRMMDGEYDEEPNVEIELKGFANAEYVLIDGFPGGPALYFLNKKGDVWVGHFQLEEGIYNYSFIVDGKQVLDQHTPITSIQSPFAENPRLKHQVRIGFSDEMYRKTISVKVPNKSDLVYITGNQNSLMNWNSVFIMKRISDFEREITLNVHLPAVFKFTRGNWETEAITNLEVEEQKPFTVTKQSKNTTYEILGWKDDK